jgi:RNA polymerase sigma factor (sigma-70 family)
MAEARSSWIAAEVMCHEGELRGWLRRYARSLTSDDIDDLVQEAYVRLWAGAVNFAAIGNVRSYFYAVVRNIFLEHARRARVLPLQRLADALRIPGEAPGPERLIAACQELEYLIQIIDALPAQCGRAFRLQKFGGLTQREIAQAMCISEKAVEKHLSNARDKVLQAAQSRFGNEQSAACSIG